MFSESKMEVIQMVLRSPSADRLPPWRVLELLAQFRQCEDILAGAWGLK